MERLGQTWINDKIRTLAESTDSLDRGWAAKLLSAREAQKLDAMVVTTKIDGDAVSDPEFVLKPFGQVGGGTFD